MREEAKVDKEKQPPEPAKDEFYIITDRVPIPDMRKTRYHGTWSVFMNMKKGQSFVVPKARYKQARSAIKWWSEHYGVKLYMEKEVPENGEVRYRIWRVS